MDYPLLNLLAGLALVLANTVSLSLVGLLATLRRRGWPLRAAWAAAAVSLLAAAVVVFAFGQRMPPALTGQLLAGLVLMASLGVLVTAGLARLGLPVRAAAVLLGLQLLASLAGVALALGLWRSLVPPAG